MAFLNTLNIGSGNQNSHKSAGKCTEMVGNSTAEGSSEQFPSGSTLPMENAIH